MEQSINPYEMIWLDRNSAWMDPSHAYLTDGTLPPDSKEVV